MKHVINLVIVILIALSPASSAQEPQTRVLMLISSFGTEDKPDLSYDLEELAQSYLIMHDNNIQLEIASPKGGAVMVKDNKDELAYIQRFKSLALPKLQNTVAAADVNVNRYHAVFIVGGGGAMMDLPFHQPTQKLLSQFVADNKTVTAVCHGPAAIVDIKTPTGEYFVKGKQVNSFTNVEEKAFSKDNAKLFKFLVEDRLNDNGAHFVSNKPMLPFVVIDNNLITAQNPSSVAAAAEATVLSLGLPLQPREMFKDEATMRLISQARTSGPSLIDIALATSKEQYDINYFALYAFYAYPLAAEQEQLLEVGLMETIGKYFSHIEYDSALITRLAEQKRMANAQAQLALFKQRYPQSERIEALEKLLN